MTAVIKNFIVSQIGLDNNRLDLFWRFIDGVDPLRYEIRVFRSQAISGPFDHIATTYNAVSYTDWEVDPDFGEKYYYYLEVVDRTTSEVVQTTKTKRFEPPLDIIATEIRRRFNLLLSEYIGVPVLYYPLRLSGNERCPDCWDEYTKQRVKSRCETCFDTGFISGYYNPIYMKMFIHDDPTALVQNAEIDEVPVRTATAIMPANFLPYIGDLIVEPYQDRWLVNSYSVNQKLRADVSYTIKLHHVLETDVRYKVPLPQEDMFINIERNREFTRPYTLLP